MVIKNLVTKNLVTIKKFDDQKFDEDKKRKKRQLLCVALFRLILIRISYIFKKVQIRRIKVGGYNSNTP